jgi:catechol 2,3-dioxygenase-like lactoylglutathione lyase family enzyme
MQERFKRLFCVFVLMVVPALFAGPDETQVPQIQSTVSIMTQNSMNVFRRFAGDAKPVYEFYGKVLGLKQLATFNLGGGTGVARFDVGTSQVKFSAVVPNRKYHHGAIQDATGLRLLTFFFPNQAPLVEGFRSHNLAIPEFHPFPGSKRSGALVQDPDGQWVELVIAPDEPAITYEGIEIGLVVSNLETSRKFYREFVGLEELPPVEDPILHTTKYPYRHGTTIVSLYFFGKSLPADTGSGGIQYVVSSAQAVEDLAKARQVKIAQPISTLPGFGLKTVWLDDPDGITNYFAQVGPPPGPKKQ